MWLASYGAAESSQSYWSTQLRSLIQPGFEPGANLVSSCPSGTSLFETILNPHSTKLRRKMPSPKLKCRNSAISSTVAAIEMPQFTGDFGPSIDGEIGAPNMGGGGRGTGIEPSPG